MRVVISNVHGIPAFPIVEITMVCTHVCICVGMYVSKYVCMSVSVFVCLFVCMSVHVHGYVYV